MRRCAAGIVSQFALFRFDPRVLESLARNFLPNDEQLLTVADSIVEISLGGIAGIRAQHTA